MNKPACGCYAMAVIGIAERIDKDCLYPTAIETNQRLLTLLAEAKSHMQAMVRESAWAHSPTIDAAEKFLTTLSEIY